MDNLEKLIDSLIIMNKSCINEISNINISCNRCPYSRLDSTLNFNCAIADLKRAVNDVHIRTEILLKNNNDLIFTISF